MLRETRVDFRYPYIVISAVELQLTAPLGSSAVVCVIRRAGRGGMPFHGGGVPHTHNAKLLGGRQVGGPLCLYVCVVYMLHVMCPVICLCGAAGPLPCSLGSTSRVDYL